MLRMRESQLAELDAARRRELLVRLVRDVGKTYPRATAGLSSDELTARVDAAIDRAVAYGMTRHASIADFVGLTFDIGPEFDEHPSVQRRLTDPAVPPDLRMQALFRTTTPAAWQAIRAFAAARRVSRR